jgi:hypothetical protein
MALDHIPIWRPGPMAWVTQLVQDDLISRPQFHLQRPYFQMRSHAQVPGDTFMEKSPLPSVLWNLTLFQYGGLAQWSGSWMTSFQDPQFLLQRPYIFWGHNAAQCSWSPMFLLSDLQSLVPCLGGKNPYNWPHCIV